MSLFYPEDLEEMRQAIFVWARAELAASTAIIWAEQNATSPNRPYVSLSLFSPPTTLGSPVQTNTGHGVLVRTVAPLTAYTITIAGTPYTYTSGATTSATAIRDGLVDALVTGGLTAAAMHTLAQDSLGIDGSADLVVSVTSNLRRKIAQQTIYNANATLAVDVFAAATPGTLTGALEIAAALELSLDTDPAQETLTDGGWSLRTIEGQRDGNVTMNAKREDRAGFDVRLGCKTRQVRMLDWIETVAPTGIVGTYAA